MLKRFAAGALLVALTVVAYWPSLSSPLTHYDDNIYVYYNLSRLTPPGWAGLALQFDSKRAWSGEFVEFFPLRDSVYWAIYQGWQLNPLPYHLTSLVFHLLTSLLVWLLFSQVGLSARAAWLGALLFALHPVHIESVVWVSGLKDPMFTMFMMFGLCAYASYREKPAPWKYALVFVGLVCGFLVKSLIVAMPLVMLAMEFFIGARVRWSLIAARLAGPSIAAGLFFGTILGIGRANNVLVGPHGGTWRSHVVLAAWAQVKYLKQALLPTSYRLIYCFEPPTGWLDWRLWAGVALLAAVIALAWRWRNQPLRLFLMAFYVLAILPVSNLVPFPSIMADRYLYAPTVGTCGLLALLATSLRQRTFIVVTAAVAVLLTASTALRAALWQDEELLWEEPDLDPACVTDTSYPAAQSHILRYFTTRDRATGLMALERAMVSPGMRDLNPVLVCTALISAADSALELEGDERAQMWARLATTMCPASANAWNAAMLVSLHKRPRLAAGAATKAWRLLKTPETEVLMWLTRLELDDPRARGEVLRLSQLNDRRACARIVRFTNEVPRLAPALGEASFHCEQLFPEAVDVPESPPK